MWLKLATVFNGSSGVYAYDLMNEPAIPHTADWLPAAQAAINAIRTVDMTTPIIVEGNGYSSAYQWIANGNDILKTLTDPANNLIFYALLQLDHPKSPQGQHRRDGRGQR